MGRGIKKIIVDETIDRRINGYYSTPNFVSEFIAKELLRILPNGKKVLDPCVGKEELHQYLNHKNKIIDSMDLVDFKIKYKSNFFQKDFIEFYEEEKRNCILDEKINLDYDYYIFNPPYNCHEVEYIRNNKNRLKKLFPDTGVHNMYSMFISSVIDCAKDGAVIGFITLDSFLTSKIHFGLRKKIIKECSIHTIVLCPTDLFRDQKADVRTCIMILQKNNKFQRSVEISNRPQNINMFKTILENRHFESKTLSEVILTSENDFDEFVIGSPNEVLQLFKSPRLGKKFKCVTGISTANDKKYLSNEITDEFSTPFYKNPGKNRFYTEPNSYLTDEFLELDKKISNFQVRNKHILFKEGITCSSMGVPFTACYLPPNSTFGVNANIICDHADLWWLIGYLNSSLVTYFVRGVLLRTNMITSGYVSRIPIVNLSIKSKNRIKDLSIIEYKKKGKTSIKTIQKIDNILYKELKIDPQTQHYISEFCNDLLNYT
ncbi:N-6 DNA methylase [Cysteiniphilum marinum]|uniref:N-6 DNA methylase n=1 Tax=Cysteiniphilum marinum TaxID=2774191 RepID=UPI00193B5AE8|nr:N-6 DNA methylase [Cysteiniphilum marinum]